MSLRERDRIEQEWTTLGELQRLARNAGACRVVLAECLRHITITSEVYDADAAPLIARAEAALAGSPEPFAWLHEVKEPDVEWRSMFSRQAESPWSRWLESYRAKCEWRSTPLYR